MKWYEYVLKVLTYLLSWDYILIILPVFNFFGNLITFFKMLFTGKLVSTIKFMQKVKKSIVDIKTLSKEFKCFEYRYDGLYDGSGAYGGGEYDFLTMYPTFVYWPINFFYKDRKGNCDDAEMYVRWLFKQLLKNNKRYKNIFKLKQCIYVPFTPSKIVKVHYFNELHLDDELISCFSVGKISIENKDSLAKRYLSGDEKYVWL